MLDLPAATATRVSRGRPMSAVPAHVGTPVLGDKVRRARGLAWRLVIAGIPLTGSRFELARICMFSSVSIFGICMNDSDDDGSHILTSSATARSRTIDVRVDFKPRFAKLEAKHDSLFAALQGDHALHVTQRQEQADSHRVDQVGRTPLPGGRRRFSRTHPPPFTCRIICFTGRKCCL